MIIALIAYVLTLLGAGNSSEPIVTIPPMPMYAPTIAVVNDAWEWAMYKQEAYWDYASEFDALFDSYEVKIAKNGRTMLRTGNGSFKFVKKG